MYAVCTDWTEQQHVDESELDEVKQTEQQKQFDAEYMDECYMVAARFNSFLVKFDQLDQDSWYLTDDGFIIPASNYSSSTNDNDTTGENRLLDLITIQELANTEGFQLKLKV
jgi:hypothetical protein